MLSCPNKKKAYQYANNGSYPLELEFQFKSAAENFEVIDEFAKAILVPYGKGKNIISQLLAKENIFPDMK
ncbi:MAG TPA: hypothetical protein DDY59_07040, partial [Lachnospiraceae bacterium]|nr:hypothetical protein [Lachnospiraceae bacterium]